MTTPEIDAESEASPDEGTIVDISFIGSFVGSALGGTSHVLVGGLLGAMGARFTSDQVEISALGGSAGVAISCVLLIWVLIDRATLRSAVIGLLVGSLSAATLDWCIGSQVKGRVFRWAFAASISGAFIGALYGPISEMRKEPIYVNPWNRGKQAAILAVLHAVASFIKSINCGPVGTVVAGIMGGALGSLVPSLFMSAVGGHDLATLVGNRWLVPVCWAAIGAVGGGAGGLRARALQTRADGQTKVSGTVSQS